MCLKEIFPKKKSTIRILVIQQKMIGDVLISTLICKNLKIWNPNVHISFIANRHTLDVVRNNPYINEIIVFEDHFKKNKWGLFQFLLEQGKERYDYVIDAYGKLESKLICFFIRAQHKIGFKKNFSFLVYSHRVKLNRELEHPLQLSIRNRFQLLEPIMGDFPKIKDVEIHLTQDEINTTRKRLDAVLGKGNQAIMVSALGSSENKSYPLNYLARLMDIAFKTTNLPFILNYRPDQKLQIGSLLDQLQPTTQEAVLKSLTPNSLRDYISTAYHCIAVVGNEGGAINIAKVLKKPTFAIFSPLIDPKGWHTETPNHSMAVDLKTFFPNAINYIEHRKIRKSPKKVQSLYKMLKPELFEKQWINFFKNVISG